MLEATSLGGDGRMKRSRLLSVGRLSIVGGRLNTSSPLAAPRFIVPPSVSPSPSPLPPTVLRELNKQSFSQESSHHSSSLTNRWQPVSFCN